MFRFDYRPGTIRYGSECVADLGAELDAIGAERALVVAGETTGTTPEVVGPVREGLGDRLAGVFAETTPAKRIGTAIEAAERLAATDADAVVADGPGTVVEPEHTRTSGDSSLCLGVPSPRTLPGTLKRGERVVGDRTGP